MTFSKLFPQLELESVHLAGGHHEVAEPGVEEQQRAKRTHRGGEDYEDNADQGDDADYEDDADHVDDADYVDDASQGDGADHEVDADQGDDDDGKELLF